jgi:hypothetical protein
MLAINKGSALLTCMMGCQLQYMTKASTVQALLAHGTRADAEAR